LKKIFLSNFLFPQLLTRLQADEAMIKSLTEQVNELTSSDTLSRVRDGYSSALAQSNQQHQQEMLTLQQQIGELREEVDRKVLEILNLVHIDPNVESLRFGMHI
jgi:hypothetical protein